MAKAKSPKAVRKDIAKDTVKLGKDGWPVKFPFLMRDTTAFTGKPVVVIERSVNAWRGVAWGFSQSAVVDRVMHDRDCDATGAPWARFTYLSPEDQGHANDVSKTHFQWMRRQALEGGATPEAIRLLGSIEPFTKKEQDDMTEKLAKKGAAAKAPKADKKAKGAEAEAPKSGRKGNPEALAKAREARANAGPDTRKIKILNKENPYRDGSNRAASFDALKGAKTVEDYKTAGGKAKYLSKWAEEGRIELN